MTCAPRQAKCPTALLTSTLAALGLLVGCVSPPPPTDVIDATQVEPAENEVVGVDQVVILLDASGSMDMASRYASTQNLASSFVAGMPDAEYSAAVITFGGDASEILALAPFDRDALDSAVIDAEMLGKSSDIAAVLREVAALLADRTGTTAIVIFSDGVAARYGRDLGHASTLAAAQEIARTAARDGASKLCFIAVQSGHHPAGTQLMQRLAGATDCGQHAYADSLTDAASLLQFQQALFVTASAAVASDAPPEPVFVDRDADGVEDGRDQCLDTPRMAHVNEFGCWVLDSYTFETKQWEILESQYGALDRVAEVLGMNPGLRIRIDGHTDSSGTEEFNQTLSQRRAGAVRDYLEAAGIDPARLETRGFGMGSPVADNDTPSGMAKNRRCQLTVLR